MQYGGVIQYDYGEAVDGSRFVPTETLDKPPEVLLKALARLRAQHMVHGSEVRGIYAQSMERYPRLREKFFDPGEKLDRLFAADYNHLGFASQCDQCDPTMLHPRLARIDREPLVFYGLIASANKVVKDAKTRDQFAQDHGILCFEMEAAGLMNLFPCLVIRGVCDYSDSHKNKEWQGYAAIMAAAYAKELLLFLRSHEVDEPEDVNKRNIPSGSHCETMCDSISSPSPDLSMILPDATSNAALNASPEVVVCDIPMPSTVGDQEHDLERVISQESAKVNESQPSHSDILCGLKPGKDITALLQSRLSTARSRRSWHPWPGDCAGVFYAMKTWLATSKPSVLVLIPGRRRHPRVKDLAVETIQFLGRGRNVIQRQGGDGPGYGVFWSLSSTDPAPNHSTESLKALIHSILQANPGLFNSIAANRSDIELDDDELWDILRAALSTITESFILIESIDPSFICRMSRLAGEISNNPNTKVKFLIACDFMMTRPSGLISDRVKVVHVPLPPPQSRKIRSQPRSDCGWNRLAPRF